MMGLFLTLFLASLVGLGACVSPLSPAEEARLAQAGQELRQGVSALQKLYQDFQDPAKGISTQEFETTWRLLQERVTQAEQTIRSLSAQPGGGLDWERLLFAIGALLGGAGGAWVGVRPAVRRLGKAL